MADIMRLMMVQNIDNFAVRAADIDGALREYTYATSGRILWWWCSTAVNADIM